MQQKKQNQSQTQLEQSKTKICTCKLCFEPIEETSIHSFLFSEPKICHKCFNKFKPVIKKFSVQNCRGLYLYNYDETIRENLYHLKGCFDIELAPIFLEYFLPYLKLKYFGYEIVPAPSYIDADEERGFNHVQEIFKCLNLPYIKCIKKTRAVKQADLSAKERQNIKNVLEISDIDLSKKKILIVDDVFTTGSTINAMLDLIKMKHPKKIAILVMSKTLENNEYSN